MWVMLAIGLTVGLSRFTIRRFELMIEFNVFVPVKVNQKNLLKRDM